MVDFLDDVHAVAIYYSLKKKKKKICKAPQSPQSDIFVRGCPGGWLPRLPDMAERCFASDLSGSA